MNVLRQLQGPHGRQGARLVAALGAAATLLVGAAVVGAIAVDDDADAGGDGSFVAGGPITTAAGDVPGQAPADGTGGPAGTGGTDSGPTGPGTAAPSPGAAPAGTGAAGGAPSPTSPGGGAPVPAAGGAPAGGAPGSPAPAPAPGDRTGVKPGEVAWGVHAPITINGAPLPVAEDPVNGMKAYTEWLNQQGGINGRKIRMNLVDDGYTVDYARRAADTLINDQKNFFVSGTLGVDQIGVIATEAKKRNVPYLASGGYEAAFAELEVYQSAGSYDSAVIRLAQLLANDPKYKGKKVGVTALDSPYIIPVVNVFKKAAADNQVNVVAAVTIQKPDQQTSYISQIQTLKRAGTEVLVPLQDPVSTSRIVAECRGQLCGWTYAFSNFAHDSDVSLALMQGDWTGVRGISGGCNYVHPNAENPRLCASMHKAHAQWAAIRGEDDWQQNGQSGSAGYQWVAIWTGALREAGLDPTRERFEAALRNYDNYSDLVTGPITFRGRTSFAHGAEHFVVLEGQSNLKYKQIVPGLMDRF